MKKLLSGTKIRGFELCILMVGLLFSTIARADAVLEWNKIAVDTAAANKQSPFVQARTAAIVQVAVFEAVNAITGDYRPYLGTITAPPGASAEAAAIQAAYRVLSHSFPLVNFDNQRSNSLAQIPDGQAKNDGIATGEAAAQAMIALRANDGSSPPQFKVPGPAVPGEWQATASCAPVNGVPSGVGFQWPNVTPFGVPSVSAFLLDPPPSLSSNEYAKAYNEVMTVGNTSASSSVRPQDRANVAIFYNADTPSQVFNQAAQQVAVEKGQSLSENARTLALINMAMNDSLVASFFNKYHYNFWRPETAIHGGGTDDNPNTDPDTGFIPFIVTPCFPSYPSNHGSAGNAAAEVLRRIFGEAGHSITLTNSATPIVLQYTSFKQITDDISDARVYGGIHFRTDQEAGADLGRAIGAAVYKNNLRSVHDDD